MPDQAPSTPTPQNAFKGVLAAELAIQLGTVDMFLTALQQPNVNTEAVVQDFQKMQLNLLANAPQAESVGISGVAAAVQSQLNALVAHLQTNPVPATSAAAPATGA